MRDNTEWARNRILECLAEGKSMRSICGQGDLPSRETVRLWQKEDADFDLAVTHAREDGFHALAEQTLADVETDEDPQKSRLKFDARRWYLGKLSNAFSDNKAQKHEVALDMSDEAKAWLGQTS